MKRIALFTVLFTLIFAFSASAQTRRFKVSLSVQAENQDIADVVETYLTRELRAISDVDIVEEGFYQIKVFVLQSETASGRMTGYTVSTVINWRATCVNSEGKTRPCYVYDDAYLNTSPPEQLKQLMTEIITDFNTRSLKPLRR